MGWVEAPSMSVQGCDVAGVGSGSGWLHLILTRFERYGMSALVLLCPQIL
jgi:hypothetical protein